MQILLSVFVCAILVTTGSSLECEVCSGLGTNCTGSMQTCDDSKDTCIIALAENSLVGPPIQSILKGCESSNICEHGPQYLNLGEGRKMRSSITCCVGNACRTAAPELPPDIMKPNGKQCPACFSISTSTCNDEKIVDCVGPEERCFDLAVTVTYGSVVVNMAQKGCVSKSACEHMRKDEIDVPGVRSLVTKAECKAPPATAGMAA